MRYTKFGPTAMDVSAIWLGCMSFRDPLQGEHTWSLHEAESREIIKQALDAGINFSDTANIYSGGTSEEVVGRALGDMANRDEIVLATKVGGPKRDRGHSLQSARSRAADAPVGRRDRAPEGRQGNRGQMGATLYDEGDEAIVTRTLEVAQRLGHPHAQVGLAWLLSKSIVTAPIVGANKPQHLIDAIAAVELKLSEQDIIALEEPYYRPPCSRQPLARVSITDRVPVPRHPRARRPRRQHSAF